MLIEYKPGRALRSMDSGQESESRPLFTPDGEVMSWAYSVFPKEIYTVRATSTMFLFYFMYFALSFNDIIHLFVNCIVLLSLIACFHSIVYSI